MRVVPLLVLAGHSPERGDIEAISQFVNPRRSTVVSPMGGERASTTRMRLSGRICCACKTPLAPDPKHLRGERYCARCASKQSPATHRVYMSFMQSNGWFCQFLEEDLKTPLPRKLTFVSSDKIIELAERAGALRNLESH